MRSRQRIDNVLFKSGHLAAETNVNHVIGQIIRGPFENALAREVKLVKVSGIVAVQDHRFSRLIEPHLRNMTINTVKVAIQEYKQSRVE